MPCISGMMAREGGQIPMALVMREHNERGGGNDIVRLSVVSSSPTAVGAGLVAAVIVADLCRRRRRGQQ